jgi:hypothetical protein
MKVLVYSIFSRRAWVALKPWFFQLPEASPISAIRAVRHNLKVTEWFPPGFAIFLYANLLLVPILYTSLPVCQNYVVNTYLWLLIGILFRLPQLALDGESSRLAEALVDGRRR